MSFRPETISALQSFLREAEAPVGQIDRSAFTTLVNHVPEDMTATVQAGMKLSEFQDAIGKRGQWLPVDPPFSGSNTIGDVIENNLNGPQRLGFGTIRDWLIGLRFVMADGREVFNGGNVVKNVAGFDLCKLLAGSRGALGVVVEATFKLSPIPEKRSIRFIEIDNNDAPAFIERIRKASLSPVVLDLFKIDSEPVRLAIGFCGAEADVEAQLDKLEGIADSTEGNLEYDATIRATASNARSMPPANLPALISETNSEPWVIRAGNGILYSNEAPKRHEPTALEQRVKETFDPKGILPPL